MNKPKITSSIVPLDFLEKFPDNDLPILIGEYYTVIDNNGKIIKYEPPQKPLL